LNCAAALRVFCTSVRTPRLFRYARVSGANGYIAAPKPRIKRSYL
jgi:hypothetical protein